MGDGVSDLVKRGEGWASDAQKREAEDMALARAAYNLGWCEANEGVRKFDPRVILTWARKVMQ